jgi:hypothetical protein
MQCCWNIQAIVERADSRPAPEQKHGRGTRRRSPRAPIPRVDDASPVTPGRALQAAWITFVEQWDWEWFCTLTFRGDIHPEAAAKRFDGFASRMNHALYGPRWYKQQVGIQWVRALEYQRQGIIHFHAVIAGAASERPSTWEQVWDDLAGLAEIGPIRNMTAALRYLTKYVHRGGELDFEPRMRALQP